MNNLAYQNPTQVAIEQQNFITKVYGWMSLALFLTGVVAWYTAQSTTMLKFIFQTPFVFFGLIIGELILVGYLATMVRRISAMAATLVFFGYSALNGLTLSMVFIAYTQESLTSTFLITSLTFAIMSIYGYTTKKDLTNLGSLCMMGLFGVIIASLVNFFFRSPILYWATTYIGIFIFIGLIAYDTQKIKAMNIIGNEGTEEDRKEAILGALILYLDFINLFLLLLRVFGKRR